MAAQQQPRHQAEAEAANQQPRDQPPSGDDDGSLSSDVYVVEAIIGDRGTNSSKNVLRGRQQEYRVRWKGYDESHDTWEAEANILDKSLIDAYYLRQQSKGSHRLRSRNPRRQ